MKVMYAKELDRCRAIATRLAKKNGTVSIDEVRKIYEKRTPKTLSPWGNFAGAVFKTPAFKSTGFERFSSIPVSHGRTVLVWTLAESPVEVSK